MNDFSDLVRQRRSCHHFMAGFRLSDASFFEILQDVRYTPSGYNAQPWEFLLIRDEAQRKAVQSLAFGQDHIMTSGNIVILLGNTEFGKDEQERICKYWEYRLPPEKLKAMKSSLMKERPAEQKRDMVIRNCALAGMTFMYSAKSKGFITCPMMGFSQGRLAKLLELPEKIIPVLMIAIGKPDPENPEPAQLERKEAKEIGHLEEYKK